jgi:hypothetical protein
MGRFSRLFVATLVTLAVSLVVAEAAARWVFGLQPLHYRWPYQPLFVSGDYQYLVPNDRLPFASGGPDSLGYKVRTFGFYTSPEAIPASSTPLSDFLFSHDRSRYSAAEVDRIACAEPDAVLIYVLGGSVGQGFSASGKETTWHAVLERRLREKLGRSDVYVFNAAMGGFVSLQERIAFHLAVAPRNATMAIVLDGYNDVTIPANSAVRPGDPFPARPALHPVLRRRLPVVARHPQRHPAYADAERARVQRARLPPAARAGRRAVRPPCPGGRRPLHREHERAAGLVQWSQARLPGGDPARPGDERRPVRHRAR